MTDRTTIEELLAPVAVVPVLTIENLSIAVPLGRALVAGGLTVLEVTLRSAAALAAVEAMVAAVPEAVVGVGTLTRP
ncbi:MAG: keto-deoxy-phosphogluconate aldolase, partial [Alphaproteobacteria bacterium]|nr:keto-deoxy-phosphogluconate aldolase [Alphaproteobacteria bacterium]